MSLALGVPANKLRHRVPRDSGGSFGVKQSVLPYVVLMCLASRARPARREMGRGSAPNTSAPPPRPPRG